MKVFRGVIFPAVYSRGVGLLSPGEQLGVRVLGSVMQVDFPALPTFRDCAKASIAEDVAARIREQIPIFRESRFKRPIALLEAWLTPARGRDRSYRYKSHRVALRGEDTR